MTTALIVGIAMGAFFAGVGTAWLIDWVYKRTMYRDLGRLHEESMRLMRDWEKGNLPLRIRRGKVRPTEEWPDPPPKGPCVYCAPEGSIGRVSYIPCSDECRKKAAGPDYGPAPGL